MAATGQSALFLFPPGSRRLGANYSRWRVNSEIQKYDLSPQDVCPLLAT